MSHDSLHNSDKWIKHSAELQHMNSTFEIFFIRPLMGAFQGRFLQNRAKRFNCWKPLHFEPILLVYFELHIPKALQCAELLWHQTTLAD